MNFVVIQGKFADYAISAELVREIAAPGAAPLSRTLEFGAIVEDDSFVDESAPKLLLMTLGGVETVLRVRGQIAFRHLEPSDVLSLPSIIRRSSNECIVSGVAFAESQKPLLILDLTSGPLV